MSPEASPAEAGPAGRLAGHYRARLHLPADAATAPRPHHVDVVVQPSGRRSDGPMLRLAALGDSGLAGVGVEAVGQTLPVVLAGRLADAVGRPVHVRGYARSGARTADVLADQLPQLRGPVDAVLLMVGTNDVTHLTPLRRLGADTARLLDELARRGAPVVMSSLPEFRAMTAVPATVRTAARARGRAVQRLQSAAAAARPQVHLVDVRATVGARFLADPSTVSRDRFHPSAHGYRLIADALEPQLVAAVRQQPRHPARGELMSTPSPAGLAPAVSRLLPTDCGVAVRAYDGSRGGPADAAATVVVRTPQAVRRMLTAPGQLGLARAFVTGELDVEGDLYAVLRLQDRLGSVHRQPQTWRALAGAARAGGGLTRRLAPPPEEASLHGRRHSRHRDAAAISHHYDVSNAFYRLLLGPSMTYSCAVWTDPSTGLEAAQEAKHELISRKLGLRPGMRLLDVGCGWGGMVLHAAQHHGVHAVGVTLSVPQAELARERVAAAGLTDRVEIRVQDYREVDDGPYDAISSIGMFEHVGAGQLATYFDRLHGLLRPGGRLLNHGISQTAGHPQKGRNGFVQRYVFPDGELVQIGHVVSAVQQAGFEARAVENLREHYALTLRAWVRNIEERYDEAVAEVGPARARIWRLYLAGSAVGFETGGLEVHQTLAVRSDDGRSALPLRPGWEAEPLVAPAVAVPA